MTPAKTAGIAFFVIGVVFIAIGSSGQRAFLGVGAAFIVVGIIAMIRQRRGAGGGA
jgi:drug/metabolite transporter (DMT)-like permease